MDNRKKTAGIATREIGDRRQAAFAHNMRWGNDGISLMWMAPHTTVAPFFTAFGARNTIACIDCYPDSA
jgi:hypothetical protein